MRHLILGVFILLAGPAWAQAASPDNKPAATDQKAAKPDSKSQSPQPQANPQPAAPKDDAMGNFDVTGSNASDAMGAGPP